MRYPTLPPQETCRPGPQATGKGSVSGDPADTSLSCHQSGCLREVGVPTASLPLVVGLALSWPRSQHRPALAQQHARQERPHLGQPSSFPYLHLSCGASGHPPPRPPPPVSVCVLPAIPAPACVPVQFVLHLPGPTPGSGASSSPGSEPHTILRALPKAQT